MIMVNLLSKKSRAVLSHMTYGYSQSVPPAHIGQKEEGWEGHLVKSVGSAPRWIVA
jgi:hypothetical protein